MLKDNTFTDLNYLSSYVPAQVQYQLRTVTKFKKWWPFFILLIIILYIDMPIMLFSSNMSCLMLKYEMYSGFEIKDYIVIIECMSACASIWNSNFTMCQYVGEKIYIRHQTYLYPFTPHLLFSNFVSLQADLDLFIKNGLRNPFYKYLSDFRVCIRRD